MKPIKLFVFAIFFVLLFSKVTLAQSHIDVFVSTRFLDTNRIDLGGLHVGTKGSISFQIVNGGDSSLIVQEIYISGEGFRLLKNETPITLGPKQDFKYDKYIFDVEFAPTEAKDYNATITLVHNAPNLPSPLNLLPIVGTGLPFGTPILSIKDN